MKTLTPTLCGAGAVLVLEIWIAIEILLPHAARNVKRWILLKLRTITSEIGMACSRWTDRLTISIEGGGR